MSDTTERSTVSRLLSLRLQVCLIGALASSFYGAAFGQGMMQDRVVLQAVGLFQHSCLPFAGYAGNLRQWAASKNLMELPDSVAQPFLSGAAGKAFNASTADGKLILLSRDDGACMVISPYGNRQHADDALLGVFRTVGAATTLVRDSVSPDGKAEQTLEKVTLQQRAWHVSVTGLRHPEDSSSPSNLILMATATPP
jgi:hypothetical protein